MSAPIGPNWYDDPDDPKAERWWDGHEWSPNRRRKQSAAQPRLSGPPPATYFPTAPSVPESYPVANEYPAFGYDPMESAPSVAPLAAPASVPARSRSNSSFSASEAIALLLAFCGLAFIAAAFQTWGKVSDFVELGDGSMTLSVEYPGLGEPTRSGRSSDIAFQVFPENVAHNTNPGWIALVLGVLIVVAGVAYYFEWNRKIVALIAAVVGIAGLIVCISYLMDLRGAFGNPAVLVGADFSPGLGLIATTALSVVVTLAGAGAFFYEQRVSPNS
ncbi:DUF2510 domain-containing protein [Mycolicibacterium goodii]|nr:DUF2510 domain-containing protein [Mycolicibacterium goodii]